MQPNPMKIIYQFLLFTILSLASTNLFAQASANVSGIVTNEKGEQLKGATVFIGGSDRVMATDENGKFNFASVPQGTYQLSVQIIGYGPLSRNIIVKNVPLVINMRLSVKVVNLAEVVIGKKSAWAENFRLFKETFLGTSVNAGQCVIINPKVINFSTKKGLLLADADEFLIIENKRLGYRIHYQLQDFGYNSTDDIALYHGECSFEEMAGTDEQKKQWAKNRLATYQGSFMHFLRSVYTNKVAENGFIARPFYGYGTIRYDPSTEDKYKIVTNDHLVKFDSLTAAIGGGLTSLKFNQLYVIYDPQKAATFLNKPDKKKTIIIDGNSSILKLATNEAIIDQKGSYTDYRDFYIHGQWAKARVADQLPVDYQPPFAPITQRDDAIDKLANTLQKWTDSIPQEKAYLHLDKPYYAAGDTIWFKGYLTTGSRHQLSAISGAAYVELIDGKDHLVKQLKLLATSGLISGNFVLSDEVQEGSYRIRAYTQWMRNAGEDYFFDHTFVIGNPVDSTRKKDLKNNLEQTDVQFFPESGNLVNGIASRVAFKAVGVDGLGTAIKGKITDNDNTEVAEFSTLHAGMGSFALNPSPGKTYAANIIFADGTTKSVALPKTLNEGYVLSVYQPNQDSILVRIHASAALQHSTINLVAHTGGETIFASGVNINSATTSVWLEKKSFPGGIAQFAIFNKNNEPLNERLVFIKGDDRLQVSVTSAKPVYKSREHVQLDLDVKDGDGEPTQGNFSVAVINENKVPVDENSESTIFSNILLSSDIKGYIEKPNYYFTADSDEVNKALDNLMLTQGYRRFEWKLLDSAVNIKPAFKAEHLGASISGTVTDLRKRPLPNAKVILVSMNAHISKDTTADANGRFTFDKLMFTDGVKFAVQARDLENTDKTIITLDTIPQITINKKQKEGDVKIIKVNLEKARQEGKPAQLARLHILNQVDIKAAKNKDSRDAIPQGMFNIPEGSADQVITIPDPERYINLEMFMQARLQGIHIEVNDNGYHVLVSSKASNDLLHTTGQSAASSGREIQLILNGRPVGKDEADEILEGSILPEDIAKIEVVRTNQAMVNMLRQGNDAKPGYVLIQTKPAASRRQYNPGIANVTPKGFNKTRKFYSPRYDVPNDESKQPDLRTTVYWNPYVNTDQTGKTTLDFYNADSPGTYRVVIEGINVDGQLGRQVYTYKLE
jgi:hypothetical protein